ncbi:MAG: nucleotide exchange factor GrpE [Elusimicrobia bacterium]|nr:nucleotide exchange factor GrpE [Elusimicrobiota bacterium]
MKKAEETAADAANVEPAPEAKPGEDKNGTPPPDYYAQLLQLKAEFENYRKRIDRERPEYVKLGKAQLWERLLPVYDVLFQAHEQVLKLSSAGAGDAKSVVAGLELVFKEFTRIFESEGISPIETVGKPFNHDSHDVLGTVETEEHPDGTVVEELQRGYMWQGRVLRPAKVRIAKAKA